MSKTGCPSPPGGATEVPLLFSSFTILARRPPKNIFRLLYPPAGSGGAPKGPVPLPGRLPPRPVHRDRSEHSHGPPWGVRPWHRGAHSHLRGGAGNRGLGGNCRQGAGGAGAVAQGPRQRRRPALQQGGQVLRGAREAARDAGARAGPVCVRAGSGEMAVVAAMLEVLSRDNFVNCLN